MRTAPGLAKLLVLLVLLLLGLRGGRQADTLLKVTLI